MNGDQNTRRNKNLYSTSRIDCSTYMSNVGSDVSNTPQTDKTNVHGVIVKLAGILLRDEPLTPGQRRVIQSLLAELESHTPLSVVSQTKIEPYATPPDTGPLPKKQCTRTSAGLCERGEDVKHQLTGEEIAVNPGTASPDSMKPRTTSTGSLLFSWKDSVPGICKELETFLTDLKHAKDSYPDRFKRMRMVRRVFMPLTGALSDEYRVVKPGMACGAAVSQTVLGLVLRSILWSKTCVYVLCYDASVNHMGLKTLFDEVNQYSQEIPYCCGNGLAQILDACHCLLPNVLRGLKVNRKRKRAMGKDTGLFSCTDDKKGCAEYFKKMLAFVNKVEKADLMCTCGMHERHKMTKFLAAKAETYPLLSLSDDLEETYTPLNEYERDEYHRQQYFHSSCPKPNQTKTNLVQHALALLIDSMRDTWRRDSSESWMTLLQCCKLYSKMDGVTADDSFLSALRGAVSFLFKGRECPVAKDRPAVITSCCSGKGFLDLVKTGTCEELERAVLSHIAAFEAQL